METNSNVTQKMADAREYRKGRSTGKELMGMPVISIEKGEEVAKIHDIIYNAEQGRLIGFFVTRGGGLFSSGESFYLGADDLHALGEDAVTVDTAQVLTPLKGISKSPVEEAGQPVLGKRLLTEGGKFLGNVEDVLVERETRRVVAYEVSGGLWQDMMRGQSDVPVSRVTTIGKDVVVVPDIVEDQVMEPTGGLIATAETAKEKAAAAYETAAEKVEQVRTEVSTALEDKEARYALGKTAGRDVKDDAENIIVREGEVITEEHIRVATAANKMHAVAVAAGQAQAVDAAGHVREKVSEGASAVREKAADLTEAAREKAADVTEAVQNRQTEGLVGKMTTRAVLLENGQPVVPAAHQITEADIAAARTAGKLDDLSAAVSTTPSSGDTTLPTVIIEQPREVVVQTSPVNDTEVRLREAEEDEEALVVRPPASASSGSDGVRS